MKINPKYDAHIVLREIILRQRAIPFVPVEQILGSDPRPEAGR